MLPWSSTLAVDHGGRTRPWLCKAENRAQIALRVAPRATLAHDGVGLLHTVEDAMLPYKSLSTWQPNTLLHLLPYTQHQHQCTYRPPRHQLLWPHAILQLLQYTQRLPSTRDRVVTSAPVNKYVASAPVILGTHDGQCDLATVCRTPCPHAMVTHCSVPYLVWSALSRPHRLTLREVVPFFFEMHFFLELDFDPKHSPQRKVPAKR